MLVSESIELLRRFLGKTSRRKWTKNLNLSMVFTVTSSDCKVKKASFYELLFTLGWKLIENKSLYKFPAQFRKYTNLDFRVFTVGDTKRGMLSHWKKSLSLTISGIKRCVLCARMLALEWKERASFYRKSELQMIFCWLPVAILVDQDCPPLSTNMASPYKALQRCVKRFAK